TASLIASCCACGATSANATKETVQQMHQFGEYIGIAFQIKDDLFDYGPDGVIGKPTGMDIKESKMTLPLIVTLNNASNSDRRKIINTVKNHNGDNKKVKEVIEMVKNGKGINYAVEQMKSYQQKAYQILESFPESIYKTSLRDLVEF